MTTEELFDRKWKVFEKRVKLFRFVPFVEFVLLAGSMATGRVHEKSDFDVIVGTRQLRVFTTWFLSSLALQLRGWREHPGVNKSNRIALTHFATPKGYTLSPPHDPYWKDLYRKLIPVAGNEEHMEQFFAANGWLNPPRVYERHKKYMNLKKSWIKRCLEFTLGGRPGNFIEKVLRKWLVKRLENSEKLGYRPRLVYSDDKLEIYRDTRRIEEMIESGEV